MTRTRAIKDRVAGISMLCITILIGASVVIMAIGLCIKAAPIIETRPIGDIIFSSTWRPMKGDFGLLPFMSGTLWVTCIAAIIAVPISLLTSIYLSEYAPRLIKDYSKPFIDLLAGIPSVIYGVWGILVVVPLVRDHIAPAFGVYSSGFSVLSAGIVLSIMIFPIIIHISVEVFQAIPYELRETSLALGATKWQTTKHVLLKKAMPGIFAANVLGFSRAFGETMAVLMVAGNIVKIPITPFEPGYPLPALIANNYGEMLSIPLYDSALLMAALVLFVFVIFFSIVSRYVLSKIKMSI